MQHATPDTLLRAWEQGMADSRPSTRSRALLGAASADDCASEHGALSVGQCDGMLMGLREQLLGSRFEAWVACPHCRQGLELAFDAADLKIPITNDGGQPFTLRLGQYSLICRAPCLDDLAYIERLRTPEERHAELLARTVLEAWVNGTSCAAAELPQSVVDALESALQECDAQVLTDLGVACDACGHQWSAPFDMVAYLWTELERWAARLMWEVSALAQGFGWNERDLITMNPWRRQRYLEMLGK